MLIFTNFVPISLLVNLEIVRLLQSIIITFDEDLKSSPDIGPIVQSSNLNEEIGQIHYLFSDKTGTLTCNVMEFKKIAIGAKSYGDDHNFLPSFTLPTVTNVDFMDQNFFNDLEGRSTQDQQRLLKQTLFHIALCHSVICEIKEGKLIYNVRLDPLLIPTLIIVSLLSVGRVT